jgi:hypothetical protein
VENCLFDRCMHARSSFLIYLYLYLIIKEVWSIRQYVFVRRPKLKLCSSHGLFFIPFASCHTSTVDSWKKPDCLGFNHRAASRCRIGVGPSCKRSLGCSDRNKRKISLVKETDPRQSRVSWPDPSLFESINLGAIVDLHLTKSIDPINKFRVPSY